MLKNVSFQKSRLGLIDSISAGSLFGRGRGREEIKEGYLQKKGEDGI